MHTHYQKVLTAFLTAAFLLFGIATLVRAETHTSTVEKIVDGDTIYIKEAIAGSKKVRLLSIDTPETNFHGKSQGEHAEKAAAYLGQLIPPGTEITIKTNGDAKDKVGRLLGHIYKGSLDVNLEMVRKGYAVTYFLYPHLEHFKEYQSAFIEAREQELGIWDSQKKLEKLPFEFRNTINKYIYDSETQVIYEPGEYKKVPIERRVFIWESDIEEARLALPH